MTRTIDGVINDYRLFLANNIGRNKDRCYKCNKEFQMGDEYHINRNNNGTKWYHQKCWKSIFY